MRRKLKIGSALENEGFVLQRVYLWWLFHGCRCCVFLGLDFVYVLHGAKENIFR